MISKLLSTFCWWIVTTFPGKYLIIGDNNTPYLGRFYIKKPGKLPGLYLHHFYRSDHDREIHNHPWKWARSFILTGGYYEERYEAPFPIVEPGFLKGFNPLAVYTFRRRPFTFNKIFSTTFHRVILEKPKDGVWTLFMPGPVIDDWGFLDRTVGRYTPHAMFLGKHFEDAPPSNESK